MLLDLFFPNRCLQCSTIIPAQELVCEICKNHISFSNETSLFDNKLVNKCKLLFPIEQGFTLMNFEPNGLSQKIIHQLKYNNREKTAVSLANWTIEKLDFGENIPTSILTVPLHPKKLKKRGYNQLHLFGNLLSEHYKIEHLPKMLVRNSYQKAQAKKDQNHRFATKYDFSVSEPKKNQHYLIIDDVFTTGSTLSAIVWEILKEPSNRISILVMAMD